MAESTRDNGVDRAPAGSLRWEVRSGTIRALPSPPPRTAMRFSWSRRRNLVLLSTRAVPSLVPRHGIRPARRRRFLVVRTGFLLAVIGVTRLVQAACAHWRVSLGLAGLLLEILGHSVLPAPVGFLGLVLLLTATLKSAGPASDRRPVMPQTAWRWHA